MDTVQPIVTGHRVALGPYANAGSTDRLAPGKLLR